MALVELELLLDFTSQDYLVVIDPYRLAESALFLSAKFEEFYSGSSTLCLKSEKKWVISYDISLKLESLQSKSIENYRRKYFTLIYLLNPRQTGSNRNFIPFSVR